MEKRKPGRPAKAAVALRDPEDDGQEAQAQVKPFARTVENPEIPRLEPEPPISFDECRRRAEKINERRQKDPVSELVGSAFYLTDKMFPWCHDAYYAPLKFSRHYMEKNLLIDFFSAEGLAVEKEIARKKEACEKRGVTYIAVPKGRQLTEAMLIEAGVR